MYIKRKLFWLSTIATLLIASFMGSCKKDKVVETTGVCPVVKSTNPVNLATSVPLSQVISVTFNEPMDPASITNASFIITGSTVAGTISYSGNTAYFTPASPLIDNHTYTGRVTTAVKDLMGLHLQTDYVWTFSTGSTILPIVISTDPANNDTDVFLNKIINATFNMPMDAATLISPATTFTLKQGTNIIAGNVTYTGSMASFSPALPVLPNTWYDASIGIGAKNPAGTALAAAYNWKFKTGSIIAPIVILTNPLDLATNVPLNQVVTGTFSMVMDPATISTSTFTLKQGTNNITGTVTYSGVMASFTPATNLVEGLVYTATITTGAKNATGVPLANNHTWSFTTVFVTPPVVISTEPVNLAINVPLNKIITANFSMAMNPATINTTTFTLKQGTTAITGVVTYSGIMATFTPSANLVAGLLYTATITTGAKNTGGLPLAIDYVWTFTTSITLPPTVILTDPVNLASGVALNKVISATFSTAMDPLTITGLTFLVKQGTTPVTGTVSYSGVVATFTPTINLIGGLVYTATITTGAKNVAGTALLADYVWNFTTISPPPTVISTDPINNATGVALTKTVTATFSTPMDPLTITGLTFTLKIGTTPVAGVVTYSGSTASFKSTVNLLSGNTYTATITTGAKNVAGVALVANYVWTFSTVAPLGPDTLDLKLVKNFGIIAGTGVSNNAGFSVINDMNVGISPGARSSITGFPPATVVNGAIYASDDVAPPGIAAFLTQAKQDLTDAYLVAEGATAPAPVTVSGDQGGLTLAPGIYKSTSTLLIQNGDLTLDAQGDVNAVWIFQIASAFTTVGGAGGNIILTGGAQAKNIYWQVGSSATIGGYTSFKGTILALTSITMGGYATATGRMLARNGAVVLTSTNIIYKP